jgi:2-phosphosulfolactate phosphatase
MIRAAARGASDVSIVCAGRDRQFALEDAACAGRFTRGVTRRLANVRLNDAAQACSLLDRRYGDRLDRLLEDSEHGRALAEAGYAEDLAVCAAVDSHPVIPIYQDRQITKLGPERER